MYSSEWCVFVDFFPLQATIQARNVEYDEVILPQTTLSTAIPTEPNTAYATTTIPKSTTIPTDQNVAYGVHSCNTCV